MAALWLVRHARPLVAAGTCYGRLDVPADSSDTQQAASRLAVSIPPGFQLVTSPLQRCVRLACALFALRPDLPLRQDSRLAEMDFGAWEGRPWSELGEAALAPWTADFAGFAPGGGETVNAFMTRVAEALKSCHDRDAVWITHAGVIRATRLLMQGVRTVRSAEDWPADDIGFGSCTVLTGTVRTD